MKRALSVGALLAVGALACARAVRPLPPYYHYARGLVLEEQGRWQEASDAYRAAALQDSLSPEPWLALADLSRRRAQWSQACSCYARGAELGSPDDEALEAWLRCCGWAENLLGVRAAYRSVLRRHPESARAVLEALRLEIELGGTPDSVVSRYGAVIAEPEHASEAAKILLEAGRADATESFLRPLAADPQLALWLGISLEAQERTEAAAELYEELAEAYADEAAPLVRLFNLRRAAGQPEEAMEVGNRLVAREEEGAFYAKTVALYALQQGAVAEAKRILLGALPRAIDDSGVRYLLATAYSREDSLNRAVEEALEAVRLDTAGVEPLLLAGWTFVRAERDSEAIALLRRGLEATGRDSRVQFLLGSLLVQHDEHVRAVPLLEAAAASDSNDPRVFYELGVAYEQLDSVQAAASAFRECLRLDPENASAYNYLGYMLADRGFELQEALQLIGKALVFEPDNGYFVDSLGWVYYRLGRVADARRELERAVSLVNDDPVVREHLGQVYLDLGMKDLAREQLTKAVELGSSDDETLRSLDLLGADDQ